MRNTQYPPFKDKVVLADTFGDFFIQKIVVIQNKLDNMAATVSPGSEKCLADSPVVQLWMVSEYLMNRKSKKLIEAALKKSYSIDQMPTPLVVGCIDILLPVITKIINLSLQTGSFANQWKCALVHSLLEKLGLDLVFQSFRQVSNLQYISISSPKRLYLVKHTSTWSSMKPILICMRNRPIVNITALKRPFSK